MIDDFYNRRMQLAQAMAQRSPVFKTQVMPNQIMQNESALQHINQENQQSVLSDPGNSKRKLAEALSAKGLSKAEDLWGVAANALEGYNIGKAEKEAKKEEEAKKKYESDARQQLAKALSSGNVNLEELAKNPMIDAGDLVNFYKTQQASQNPFGKSLTGQLAQDNYNKFIASGMDPEMAKAAAIQQAMNQAGVAAGNTVPGSFGGAPQPTTKPTMVTPPLPSGDILAGDLPNIPDNGIVPTPTVAPTEAPQPPSPTGVPYVDKINLQNWSDINKENVKSNIEIQKTRNLERPKIELGLAAARDALESTNRKIDEILPNINSMTAGAVGTALGMIPGTDAKDLKSNIKTLQARSAVDKLQEVRQASPTGGAFGNVSDKDMELLQTIVANLENSQSPEQLAKNLNEFKTEYGKVYSRLIQGYKNTYGSEFSGSKKKTINFNDMPD